MFTPLRLVYTKHRLKARGIFVMTITYISHLRLRRRIFYINLRFSPAGGALRFLLVQKSNQKSTPLKKKGWLGQGYTNAYFADFDH